MLLMDGITVGKAASRQPVGRTVRAARSVEWLVWS